jgi:FkbM family methyltransferase
MTVKRLVNHALGALGYRVEGIRYCPKHLLTSEHVRVIEFDDIVCRRMFKVGRELTFIQVGAYDGVTRDPLRPYIETYWWQGVLLEPQPQPVEQLRKLCRENNRVVVLEAALDRGRGKRALYIVDCNDAPKWVGGMASFERAHIVRNSHLVPFLDPRTMIKEIGVNCMPFEDVIARLPTDRLDLLQIDAEGADAFILSLFPFDRMLPAIIHWEIKNTSKADQEETLELLSGHGYRFARSGNEDFLAVLG